VIRFILEKNLEKTKIDHLKLIINSYGGDLHHAFAIIDIMNATKIPIWTYGLGNVYSGGLIIFMAGVKGKRHIFKSASLLTHQWLGAFEGKEHEFSAWSKGNRTASKTIINHYREATGLSVDKIKKTLLTSSDVYLTPEEAIQFNLADSIVENFI